MIIYSILRFVSHFKIIPFEDENGNNTLVRPEMRRVFTEHRDDQSKKESIERARRVKAMEQFQKDVLNSGEDWESHHGSGMQWIFRFDVMTIV